MVVEPDTGLTTMCALTKTNGAANSDAAVGADLVTTDPTVGTRDIEVLDDSAYTTGDMPAALDTKKWGPLLKRWPIKPAVEGGRSPSTTSPMTRPPRR